MLPTFLNMPDWEVVSVKPSGDDYTVEATYKLLPEECPFCPVTLFGKVYRTEPA